MVCIVKLKSKIKAHKANPEEDFSLLKDLVTSKSNKEAIDSWVKEKQNEMFIHVNPEFRNCDFQYPGWIK